MDLHHTNLVKVSGEIWLKAEMRVLFVPQLEQRHARTNCLPLHWVMQELTWGKSSIDVSLLYVFNREYKLRKRRRITPVTFYFYRGMNENNCAKTSHKVYIMSSPKPAGFSRLHNPLLSGKCASCLWGSGTKKCMPSWMQCTAGSVKCTVSVVQEI